MLLIQAIRYLIDQLELNLKNRSNSKAADDSEKTLAEKLKAPDPAKLERLPREAKAPTPEDFDEKLIKQLHALKLIDVSEKGEIADSKGINLYLLGLPPLNILKQPGSPLFQQPVPALNKNIDDLSLHFGITWGQLMSTTAEEFELRLMKSLAKEDLASNKMYILARFKRQLILVCEYAKKILVEREKAFNASKGKLSFENNVDDWLKAMIAECVDEAIKLSQVAMDNAKVRLGPVSIENGPGETEGMLKVCKEVVDEFCKFCEEVNQKDHVKKTEQNSMVDLFPNKIQKHEALRLINEKAAQDLVERLFKIATCKHYPQSSWYFSSWNPLGFSPKVATDKCAELAKALHAFEEIAVKNKEGTVEFWDAMFKQTHVACEQSKLHAPSLSIHLQQSTLMWKEIHSALVLQVPFQANDVKEKHRNCTL